MLNVAVIFGGMSCEHDVSIITALQMMDSGDAKKYQFVPIYIDKTGKWYSGSALRNVEFFQNFDPSKADQVYIDANAGVGMLRKCSIKGGIFSKGNRDICHLDVVIPAIHGMNGEDGTLQGLLEMADIPYTSPGVLGSAVGMDKIAMRLLFKGAGFPVLPFHFFTRNQWQVRQQAVLTSIEEKLAYPVYVKPANLGSSIGISRADNREMLIEAIKVAISYDSRVIVERGLECTEINCSALGYGEQVQASLCEQPISWEKFLTFDDKYLRGGSTKGMKSLDRLIPAPISQEMTDKIRQLTIDIFRATNCRGVVRVDYMIDKQDDTLYVNEINTVPGSFSFYLWEPAGVSYGKLIDTMIECAFSAHQDKQKNNFAYDSGILSKFGGAKIHK